MRCAVHTMDELRMTGNCLQGSRPVLHFDKAFDTVPHLQLLREMFTQVRGCVRAMCVLCERGLWADFMLAPLPICGVSLQAAPHRLMRCCPRNAVACLLPLWNQCLHISLCIV